MKTLFKISLLLPALLPRHLASQQKRAIHAAEHFADSLRLKQNIPGLSIAVGTAKEIFWYSMPLTDREVLGLLQHIKTKIISAADRRLLVRLQSSY